MASGFHGALALEYRSYGTSALRQHRRVLFTPEL